MVRLVRTAVLVFAAVLACAVLVSAAEVEADAEWPTLLEHTAIAGGQWAPTPRNRLEKLQLTQTPRIPEFLGAKNNQLLFAGSDARGGPTDTPGNQRENNGRSREPTSDHFNENHGAAGEKGAYAGLPLPAPRAPRRKSCGKDKPCSKKGGPVKPAPLVVPPPPAAPLPEKKPAPKKEDPTAYPVPPPPENPLPTPPAPSCGELCNPDAKDPVLSRVPSPPLNDEAVAAVGLEGSVLAKVLTKLRNREGWLRAQKTWLGKAVEAAATVRREIELAEFTKDAVASDLEQLKIAQDSLSIKYKADRLKWSYKDKKITLEALMERLEALEHAKADVAHQIRSFKDEVTVLENTLGPPSQQVQISPEELEDPLKFLEDVEVEDNYGA